MERTAGRKSEKGRRELLGVVNIFPDWIVLMVSQSINMPKLSKSCILNMCSKLYVNYTYVKLFKKNVTAVLKKNVLPGACKIKKKLKKGRKADLGFFSVTDS